MAILIVDDSHVARLHLEMQLAAAGFTDVLSAASPAEAFQLLDPVPPDVASAVDLVLLDVVMPEMNGVQVCQRLKSIDALRDVPVIMVTAQTETEHLAAAFAAGAMDYIT